jgi:hypothetical protein
MITALEVMFWGVFLDSRCFGVCGEGKNESPGSCGLVVDVIREGLGQNAWFRQALVSACLWFTCGDMNGVGLVGTHVDSTTSCKQPSFWVVSAAQQHLRIFGDLFPFCATSYSKIPLRITHGPPFSPSYFSDRVSCFG